jgi:transposase
MASCGCCGLERPGKSRWKNECLKAWLQNFRRVIVRGQRITENYPGWLHLACIILLHAVLR